MSWPSAPDEAPQASSFHMDRFLPSPCSDSALLSHDMNEDTRQSVSARRWKMECHWVWSEAYRNCS